VPRLSRFQESCYHDVIGTQGDMNAIGDGCAFTMASWICRVTNRVHYIQWTQTCCHSILIFTFFRTTYV